MEGSSIGNRTDGREACHRRLHGRMLWSLVVAVATGCLLFAASCSQSARQSSPVGVSRGTGTQVVRNEEVLLVPPVEGGLAGWCIAVKSGECIAARAFRGPIVAETWSGYGSLPLRNFVRKGIVLTTSEVAAVAINGGRPIPTRAESVLPYHLRAAIVEIRGGSPQHVPGFNMPVPRPLRFTPLDSRREPIPRETDGRGSFVFAIPGQGWRSPAKAPRGVCEIQARHLGGLMVHGGFVVSRVKPDNGLIVRPVLSCVSASYSLRGSPLVASVLLDATHPGSTPTPLPAMKPLPGHHGVFQAVGGALGGLGSQGQILARRVPGAWLVVGEGSGLQQRLTLLQHLSATVDL
jgi:hypothetical protein